MVLHVHTISKGIIDVYIAQVFGLRIHCADQHEATWLSASDRLCLGGWNVQYKSNEISAFQLRFVW